MSPRTATIVSSRSVRAAVHCSYRSVIASIACQALCSVARPLEAGELSTPGGTQRLSQSNGAAGGPDAAQAS